MQRHLAFRLLAFNFKLSVFGFLLLAFISGCHLNPDLQTPGESYLQGEWQQDTIAGQKALISYSLYDLKFTCDSFYFVIKSVSKINTGPDSCMAPGHWTEYVKGLYQQKNDTLHAKGLFCNKDWTIKDDKGCFRYGDYEEFFKVTKKGTAKVQFANTTNVIPINARLVKKCTCHPKPI